MNIEIVELKSVINDANIYAPNRVTMIYEIRLDGIPLPSTIRPHPVRYGTRDESEAFVKGFKSAIDHKDIKMNTQRAELPECSLIIENDVTVGISIPFEVLDADLGFIPDPSMLTDWPGRLYRLSSTILSDPNKDSFPKEVTEIHKWQFTSYNDPDNPSALQIYWG